MLNFSFLQCASCFLSFSSSFSSSVQWVLNFSFSSFRFFITSLFCSSLFCTHSLVSRRIVPQGPIHKQTNKKKKLRNNLQIQTVQFYPPRSFFYIWWPRSPVYFHWPLFMQVDGSYFSLDDSFDEYTFAKSPLIDQAAFDAVPSYFWDPHRHSLPDLGFIN